MLYGEWKKLVKQPVILPKFQNEEDKKHWGYGEEALFKMLNDIANGKLKK